MLAFESYTFVLTHSFSSSNRIVGWPERLLCHSFNRFTIPSSSSSNTMFFSSLFALTAASAVAAQSVSGTAYGFATGVTGGGSVTAAAPSDADELAEWLSDDTARIILIDQEYDFTGTSATEAGCSRTSCTVASGGQLYLGDLSCTGSDTVAMSSISYDAAGPTALTVGSNKSIISSNGKGVLKGKGLSLASGASNVIIQGIEFVSLANPYQNRLPFPPENSSGSHDSSTVLLIIYQS